MNFGRCLEVSFDIVIKMMLIASLLTQLNTGHFVITNIFLVPFCALYVGLDLTTITSIVLSLCMKYMYTCIHKFNLGIGVTAEEILIRRKQVDTFDSCQQGCVMNIL